jgi:hypothetical protein
VVARGAAADPPLVTIKVPPVAAAFAGRPSIVCVPEQGPVRRSGLVWMNHFDAPKYA